MKSIFFDEVDNTQDFAMNEFKGEPLLIVSKAQTFGRGTNQNKWQNADQSLATSLVFNKKIVNFRIIKNPIIDTIQSSFSGTTPTLYDHKAIKKSNGCNKKLFVEDFSLALELSKFGNFCFIEEYLACRRCLNSQFVFFVPKSNSVF